MGPYYHFKIVALLGFLGVFLPQDSVGFKWQVDDGYMDQAFSFSELNMYGSNNGPLGSRGTSQITIDVEIEVQSTYQPEMNVSVLFYASPKIGDELRWNFCNGLPPSSTKIDPKNHEGNLSPPPPHRGLEGPIGLGDPLGGGGGGGGPAGGPGDPIPSPGEGGGEGEGEGGGEGEGEGGGEGKGKGKPHVGVPHLFEPLSRIKFNILDPELHSFPLALTAGAGAAPAPAPSGEEGGEGGEEHHYYGVMTYTGRAQATYKVRRTMAQYVAFRVCPPQTAGAPYVAVAGRVAFKNPYGYLPGMYFGFLPWSGIRMCLYVLFDVFFFILFMRYRDKLLRVHYGIALVLAVATLEATSWFATYELSNRTGTPFCCPMPPSLVTSIVLENLRKTATRALVLLISLGWGVATPTLPRKRAIQAGIITVAYMASGYLFQITQIVAAADVKAGGVATQDPLYSLPYVACDLFFIYFIYFAFVHTMNTLRSKRETAKLEMYQLLGKVLAAFIVTFAALTLLMLLCKVAGLYFPWQMVWVETASWDILNFAATVAICLIWRPSTRAQLMAYASQLPTAEFEMGGGGGGGGGEDQEEWGGGAGGSVVSPEMVEDRVVSSKNSNGKGAGKSTLLSDDELAEDHNPVAMQATL